MIDHHHSTTNLIIDRSSSLIKPLTLKFTVIIIIINNGCRWFWFIHIPTYLIVGFEEYKYQKERYGFLSLDSWERFIIMSIFLQMNEHKRLKHHRTSKQICTRTSSTKPHNQTIARPFIKQLCRFVCLLIHNIIGPCVW